MSNYWREPLYVAEEERKLSHAEGAPWECAGIIAFWLVLIAAWVWL